MAPTTTAAAASPPSSSPPRRLTAEERYRQYKPGSIRRVRLRNFLTYSDVEFSPGPRLNVVMGPNGTGKSTILCAICLGLGGEPPLLGRADDARTFIMHDKDKAYIEIELSPRWPTNEEDDDEGEEPKVHVIRRLIDRNKGSERGRGRGASKYFINDNEVKKAEVQRIVSEVYSIAIDNLCTFLPQDRVGSFSGFDDKSLLIETEKSLSGSKHLYDIHQKLITLEEELKTSGNSVESIQDKLRTLEEENARLEREKDLMEERREALRKMELYEQKRAWLAFEDQRMRATDLKEQRDKMKAEFKRVRAGLVPLEEKVAELDSALSRTDSRSKSNDATLKKAATAYDKNLRKSEKFADEIETAMNDLASIESMRRRAERAAQAQRAKVEDLMAQMSEMPPEDEIETELDTATAEMKELRSEMNRAKREAGKVDADMKELRQQHHKAAGKLERMNDDRARRNERIFRQNANLAKVYEYVDGNRKEFRRKIWGPIVTEIVTDSQEAAAFVEQHVPRRVLLSFVVECDEDYNLLFREVREKRKMAINISKVPGGRLDAVRPFCDQDKMEMLKNDHGVVGTLEETFAVPDPVLQVLRTESSVHQVLVGTEKTQTSIDRRNLIQVLSEGDNGRLRASCVFTKHRGRYFKYTSTVSRYSGKTSLRVDDISPARMLAPGVSPEAKAEVERHVDELNRRIEDVAPREQKAKDLYLDIQRRGQDVQRRVTDAKNVRATLQRAKQRLTDSRRKLEELEESASKDNAAEVQEHSGKLKRHTSNSIAALENAAREHGALMKCVRIQTGLKMSSGALAASKRKAEDRLEDKKAETKQIEQHHAQLSDEFKAAKKKLTELSNKAKEVAPIRDERTKEFLPLKAVLDELPGELHEIEALVEEAQSKVNSITENPEVLVRYEQRKEEIAQTKEELENLEGAKDAKRQQMNSMMTNWEQALTNCVEKVNVLFSQYMSELGCAGEVRLKKGGSRGSSDAGADFHNFREWGVEILVKFREKSSLQVLSAQVQSGGERSVSTIMYLMALQDLMVSPFRCVDEINQGLDDRNERLVFKRIVANSTLPSPDPAVPDKHSGQYFLITPKLLPNLTDMENENVTILCILNGPHNFKHYGDWNVGKFLEKRGVEDGDLKEEEEEEEGEDEDEDEGSPGQSESLTRKKRKVQD